MEHRGHHVRMGDAVLLDELHCGGRIPLVHQHHGRAVRDRGDQRQVERRGVVERAGAEVGVAGHVARDVRHPDRAGAVMHPFRIAGGAGGVEHRPARERRRTEHGRRCRHHIGIAVETRDVAGDRDGPAPVRRVLERLERGRAARRVGEQHARPAVAHDVAGLTASEVEVDGRELQARADARRPYLDELRPVAADQRDPVAGLQPHRAECVRQPVRGGVERAEGAIAVLRHDRRRIGLPAGPVGDRHPAGDRRVEVVEECGGGRRIRGVRHAASLLFTLLTGTHGVHVAHGHSRAGRPSSLLALSRETRPPDARRSSVPTIGPPGHHYPARPCHVRAPCCSSRGPSSG